MNELLNDLHVYAHPQITVDVDSSVSPDFQITEEALLIDNRVSTAPITTEGLFGVGTAVLTTGQYGGNELQNQNAAADLNLFLPTLASSEMIEAVGVLSPLQRVTVTYQNTDVAPIEKLQTVFLGHYVDRKNIPAFPLVRPYTYWSGLITLDDGETGEMYINIDAAYDLLVRQFLCQCPSLGALVTITDRQYALMNNPVFAETVAYRTFGEVSNFKAPFAPWIAGRSHRYIVRVTNVSGQRAQNFRFAFMGNLCEYLQ